MVNTNSITLFLSKPEWLSDEAAIAIARRLKKQGWEIHKKVSEETNEVMYLLRRIDGAKLSSKWCLVIRFTSPLFGGEIEWKIVRKD